ncbi:MAG: deaminase [Methylococcales bacterium]|nr:deaminase [Methylococcales bacterium]
MNSNEDMFKSVLSETSQALDSDHVRAVSRRDFLRTGATVGATATVAMYMGVEEAVAKTPPDKVKHAATKMADVTDKDRDYMREAIRLMREAGVINKTGGPFGAVIVKDGEILAMTGNSVIRDNDPSAHAEVNAVREACRKLGTFDLSGAVMYSSCECCPMCYSTAYWARIGKIYYAAGWQDYADLFDDSKIGQDMTKPYPQRLLAPQQILQTEAQKVWVEFRQLPDRAHY